MSAVLVYGYKKYRKDESLRYFHNDCKHIAKNYEFVCVRFVLLEQKR